MGIRDNIDVESATISVSIWKGNSMTEENTLVHFENVEVSSLTEANTNFEAVDGNWSRGQLKNTLTRDIIGPKVAPQAKGGQSSHRVVAPRLHLRPFGSRTLPSLR